jgi:hypothetical protein
MKKGIIFTGGDYPVGSSARRIKGWHDGLEANGISTEIIITFPEPSYEDKINSEEFVSFMLKPSTQYKEAEKKYKRNLISVYQKIVGNYRGFRYIIKQRDFSL